MTDEFCLIMPDIHVTFRDLLHAVNLRYGTNGFTSFPKDGVMRIFFALKNPTASTGFEPTNLGTKGQHATSRPPKPLIVTINIITSVCPSAWNNSAPTGRIFMKFDIWRFFENMTRKFKCQQNLSRITGTLHNDLCAFMIYCWIFLRMRNL